MSDAVLRVACIACERAVEVDEWADVEIVKWDDHCPICGSVDEPLVGTPHALSALGIDAEIIEDFEETARNNGGVDA